jgi:autonomous glycyl radical cofactor GrcA
MIASESTPEDVKPELKLQKEQHLNAAVTQRRMMQTFIKAFVKKLDST